MVVNFASARVATSNRPMTQIDQIQIKFVPAEDRLLLRVSTKDGAEFRFWLTRRFIKLLWPALGKTLTASPRIQLQQSPDARREILAFEHQQAVSAADFSTPYKEIEKALPLGDAPVLLTKLQLRTVDANTRVLTIGPEQGPGIDLTLNDGLTHSIVELIGSAMALATWDITPVVESVPAMPAAGNITIN